MQYAMKDYPMKFGAKAMPEFLGILTHTRDTDIDLGFGGHPWSREFETNNIGIIIMGQVFPVNG